MVFPLVSSTWVALLLGRNHDTVVPSFMVAWAFPTSDNLMKSSEQPPPDPGESPTRLALPGSGTCVHAFTLSQRVIQQPARTGALKSISRPSAVLTL